MNRTTERVRLKARRAMRTPRAKRAIRTLVRKGYTSHEIAAMARKAAYKGLSRRRGLASARARRAWASVGRRATGRDPHSMDVCISRGLGTPIYLAPGGHKRVIELLNHDRIGNA